MRFETLNSRKNKYFLHGLIVGVLLLLPLVLSVTFGKYQTRESFKLVEGSISYKPYDFKIMAMYQENGNGDYEEIETMPTGSYIINEEKSYCTLDNVNKDNNAILKTNTNGEHIINNLSKNDKCYLYFDQNLYSQIINYTMLYDSGNEFEEITGGWKDGSVYESNLSSSAAGVQTTNMLDVNGYNGIAFISSLTKNSGREDSIDFRINVDSQITSNMNSGLFFIHGDKYPYSIQYDVFILDSPLISESNKFFNVFLRTNAYYSTSRTVQKNEDNISINASYDVYQNFTLNMYMAAILKPDDWSTLGSIAGITVPLTLEELVGDSSALETIMNNKNAVNFMIMQCTGDFMASAVQSNTFLDILNNSPYKDLVYANEHWAKFLSMIE